jgi:nitrite reductase/ring-hydroxylating ferredoxin subunit/uncharacterized membrane protein
MISKANIKSHPIHPILVSFPIAFYIGTLVFDVLAIINNNVEFAVTGKYVHIAGIIGAVLAAIPGIIDYTYTVPPNSSAKKRATHHGLTNSLVLIIFIVALYLKYREDVSPYVLLAMELIGVGLTFYAGWLGGTLVHRNQISVDIRYAGAGKWKELYIDDSTGKTEVCSVNELKVDQMKLIHLKDKRVVVARTEEGYVAFDDRCTHKGGSLAGGAMICGTVQCPWHGSQFDVKTGAIKAGPGNEGIKTYKVATEGDKVYLLL